MNEYRKLIETLERIEEGYPANARTDSAGNQASWASPDNLKTSGLSGAIETANQVIIPDDAGKETRLERLFGISRFNLLAYRIQDDFRIKPNETIRFGSYNGYQFIKTADGRGYKAKGNTIFKI